MADTKLSKNFSLSEFVKNDISSYSLSLLKLLASQLQTIRDSLQEYAIDKKKAVSVIISSGVRTQADYDRLKNKGYNPSKTSDHFCGLQLYSKPTLGAADIRLTNCSIKLYDVAELIISMNKSEMISVGQVIYEYNPKTKYDWIHIGNDWTKIYDANFLKEFYTFERKKYLMSLDNGKSYSEFNKTAIKRTVR